MAPTIRGLMKLHKEGAPSTPTINWKNSQTYKLAKILSRNLHTNKHLPYTFNVEKSVLLLKVITDIPYYRDIKFASLEIN
jgi:L-arabinose isomerase